MRTIFVILIVAVVALIGAFQLGLINIHQTQSASLPRVEADDGTLRASGGQGPAFDVATGSVEVKSRDANVAVPKITIGTDRKSVAVPSVEVNRAGTDNVAEPKAN